MFVTICTCVLCATAFALLNAYVVCLHVYFIFCLQTYTINTFLTHRWVVMLDGAEVKTWIVSEREEKQRFVLSKAGL